jgi:D-lactate dehydrogenase (cytochrome)
MRPGWDVLTTDVCVPISCLADAIGESERRAKELNLLTAIVGHVGDGNFHILVLFDGADSAAEKLAYDYASSIVQMAIAMGGTCTGEHGIGLRKKKYLATELGDEAVNAMVTIKRAMDPLNILNPGKIFDVV